MILFPSPLLLPECPNPLKIIPQLTHCTVAEWEVRACGFDWFECTNPLVSELRWQR